MMRNSKQNFSVFKQVALAGMVCASIAGCGLNSGDRAESAGGNHSPTISGNPATLVAEGAAYQFVPVAADNDAGDTLSFTVANKPGWAQFDTATGTLQGTPSMSDAGDYANIAISVSDGHVSVSLESFAIQVTNTNRAPAISGISNRVVSFNQLYAFSPKASDLDGDALTFSIKNKPTWASFDTSTGTLSGTPVAGNAGTTEGIEISVSDGLGGGAVLMPFSLTVCNGCASPIVLFTDLVAGPTSGGENNNGAYLNIFGFNFGSGADLGIGTKVYINDVEVAAYKYLANAKAQPMANYGQPIQQLAVQVGSLGGLAAGVSGAIKVVAAGVPSNTDLTFVNQPGDIIYVALTGDDAVGDGSFANPYRYVQNSTRTNPAWTKLGPGDTIVLRGGNWSDAGWDNRFVRIRQDLNPTAPNGVAGNGYVAFQAYPGEDVVINLSVAAGNYKGAFSGPSSTYNANSHYIVFSGFTVHDDDATKPSNIGAGGPFNSQTSGEYWRIVNNEMTVKIGEVSQKAAAISGGFRNAKLLGNYIHDIQGITVPTATITEVLINHGMYFDNYTNDIEVAFNQVENISGGSGLQFFGNLGTSCGYPSCPLDRLEVHHNLVSNVTGKYGLNFSKVTVGGNAYNNIVMHTKLAGLRLGSYEFSNFVVAHNSFFDVGYGDDHGSVFVDGTVVAPDTVYVENNIFYQSLTSPAVRFYSFYNGVGSDAGITLNHNLWYGSVTKAPTKDADALYGDPKYASVATGSEDLRISNLSPAYNAAVTAHNTPIDDLLKNPRGGVLDIGALEVQ